jgi:hypothetical protein
MGSAFLCTQTPGALTSMSHVRVDIAALTSLISPSCDLLDGSMDEL